MAYIVGHLIFWYFFTKWTGLQYLARFLYYRYIRKEEMPTKCSKGSSTATDFQQPSWSSQSSTSEEEPF